MMPHNKQAMYDAVIVGIVLLVVTLFLGQGLAILALFGI